MITIVHSIYSQSVHAPALNAGLMDNDAERYYIKKNYSKQNIQNIYNCVRVFSNVGT